MTEVFIVYNDDKQIEKVKEIHNESLTFHFINTNDGKGKKEGLKLKNYWAAKLEPFAIILQNGKPIKAFYSEYENIIDKLYNYLVNKKYET